MFLLYILIILSLSLNFFLVGIIICMSVSRGSDYRKDKLKWDSERRYYIDRLIHNYDDGNGKFTMKRD